MSYNAPYLQVLQNRVLPCSSCRVLHVIILWILVNCHSKINHHNEEARVFARRSALFSSHSVCRVNPKVGGRQTLVARCLSHFAFRKAKAQQHRSPKNARAIHFMFEGLGSHKRVGKTADFFLHQIIVRQPIERMFSIQAILPRIRNRLSL
jgi:hypothetical protein